MPNKPSTGKLDNEFIELDLEGLNGNEFLRRPTIILFLRFWISNFKFTSPHLNWLFRIHYTLIEIHFL